MAYNKQKIDPRLAQNYADLATDDQRAVYRQWADSYDEELIEEFGYIAPQEAVNAFVRRVPDRTAPVLDMGCGTGLAGKLLDQAGYTPDTQIAGLSSARWSCYRHSERERMAGYRVGRVIRTKSAPTRLQT